MPSDRLERGRLAYRRDAHFAAIDAQLRAVVRNARARRCSAKLPQHVDELRLARGAESVGRQELAQRDARVELGASKVPRRASECLAPARVTRTEKRRDVQPDEIARVGVGEVAFVLDPGELVLARIGDDRLAPYLE